MFLIPDSYLAINRNFCMRYPVGVVFLVLASVLSPASIQAKDFQICNDCHEETLLGDSARFYLHSPFVEQQCGECHTAAESTVPGAKAGSARLKDHQHVNWLGDSTMVDTSHAFLLPADQVGAALIVDLQETDGSFSRRQLAVPPLDDLVEVEDSGNPPTISEVQVLKVERGVFLSVTIGWRTDTLTKAMVHYFTPDLSLTSKPDNRFGRHHEVPLYGLQPDQTYHFSVFSTDLFGRSQSSETLEFSTVNPSIAPLQITAVNSSQGGTNTGLTNSFQRLGANYLLELTLTQPAAVYVGSKGTSQEHLATATTSTIEKVDEQHAGLSSKAVISMGACGSCHADQSTVSHPVNVYPKPGMTIPPEYPTLSDGRITCSSCHAPHGSDNFYLARKSGKRELCVGCHLDML
jgi:predicted CXXCH cytochrome family protein